MPFPFESQKADAGQILDKAKSWVAAQDSQFWMFIAATIGSMAVAWFHLRSSSIWYDEAITLLTTSGHAKLDWSLGLLQFKPSADFAKIVTDLYQQDVHPPLYFWTLAIWRVVFGESLEVARSLSALFTVGSLCLLYLLAKDLDMKWPAIPAVVYVISAVGLRYAYNARPYAMASFLVLLTLFLARRKSNWTGACAAACIATHYFAALCAVPIILLECLERWKASRRWVLFTTASFALCCTPLIPLLKIHMKARPLQYPGFGSLPQESWALLKGSIESIMPSTWLPGWGIALLIGTSFVVLGSWFGLKEKKSLFPLAYGAFLLGFFLLAILTNKSIAKMPGDYYLGIAAPCLALLIGFGVSAFPKSVPLLALVLVVGTLTSTPMTNSIDYRAMMGRIRAECSDCTILVGVGYAGAIPACVLYESKGMNVLLLNPEDTVGEVIQRTGERRPIFLVPTNEPATADIEHRIVQEYPSRRRNGYFEINVETAKRQ